MLGYLAGFIFYTLAMIGVILLGYVAIRKLGLSGYTSNRKSNFLSIESHLPLEPRKNLYVIKAGTERFLVSTDIEGSKLLTKLDPENIPEELPVTNLEINPEFNTPIYKFARKINEKVKDLVTTSGIQK